MSLFGKPRVHDGAFGTCCRDLRDALTVGTTSMFRVEDSGVFYLTIGSLTTPEGTGYMDQAVIFCPFCGVRLQERETIAALAAGQPH